MERETQQKEKVLDWLSTAVLFVVAIGQSELELLVMSDTEEDGRQHFSLKKILESEKQQLRKGKKRRKNRANVI